LTRNLWINTRAGARLNNNDGDQSLDDQFSSLVEQEVERRVFEEKRREREALRAQKEQELAEVRRQHEREIYLLKKELATSAAARARQDVAEGASASSFDNNRVQRLCPIQVDIPSFRAHPTGGYVLFEVRLAARDAGWIVRRRFRQFRDLHANMCQLFRSSVAHLPFPSRRIWGSASEGVSRERRSALETYLKALLAVSSAVPGSPLAVSAPGREDLINLSRFFEPAEGDDP